MRKSSLPPNYINNSNVIPQNQSEQVIKNPIFVLSVAKNNNNNNQSNKSIEKQKHKITNYQSDGGHAVKKFSHAFQFPSNTQLSLSQQALLSPKGKKNNNSEILYESEYPSYNIINMDELKGSAKPWNMLNQSLKKTHIFECQSINFENGSNLQNVIIEFFNQSNNIKEFKQIFLSLVRANNDSKCIADELFIIRNAVVLHGKGFEKFYKILLILWEDPTTSAAFLEYLKLLHTKEGEQELFECQEELDALQKNELFQKQSLLLIDVLEKGGAHQYAKLFAAYVFKEKIEAFLKSEKNKMFKDEIVALIKTINDPKRVIAELFEVRSKLAFNEKTRMKFNKFIFFLLKKKATIDVFLQYVSYLNNEEELAPFQKSKVFQKNTRQLIKRMAGSEIRQLKNQENASKSSTFVQFFATPLLRESILTMLKKKRPLQELDSVFVDLITIVKDRRWVANELLKIRNSKEVSTEKLRSRFYSFLFLLWENRLTVDVFFQYLVFTNIEDHSELVKCSEFQQNPLHFIDLLAHCEIPDKLNLMLIRESCQTKYFALDLLNRQMNFLYQELEKFLPENMEISLDQLEGCLNKIYYSEEFVIRTLPRDVVLLLEKIRMRFKFNKNYGDGVGIKQVSELLFFSGIIFHLGMKVGQSLHHIAPLTQITTELTSRLNDNIISKESPFRSLLDKFEGVHREFIEKNSSYSVAFLEEKIIQEVETEQEEREIDD